jgi:NADH-quinone oxidoreductase subunit F
LYNDKTYTAKTESELNRIFSPENKDFNQANTYTVGTNTIPVLTSKINSLETFYALADKFTGRSDQVIRELKIANLRGRGGAGFPFWLKLDAVFKEESEQKYIVCNADEGDPGAYSDMYLMEHQPQKVLFGMYAAGKCVGANTGVLYIRGEYPDSIRIVNSAIEELHEKKLINDFNF